MNTFLGVDNVREGQIILACKEMRPTGEVRQLWREKLRTGGRAIGPYFDEIFQENWPVTVATTWLDRDPAGALARFVQKGGHLIRYHPWELERLNEVPPGFEWADALATQAILDEQVPLLVQSLRQKLAKLQTKLDGLGGHASWISQRLGYLETLRPELIEIPF